MNLSDCLGGREIPNPLADITRQDLINAINNNDFVEIKSLTEMGLVTYEKRKGYEKSISSLINNAILQNADLKRLEAFLNNELEIAKQLDAENTKRYENACDGLYNAAEIEPFSKSAFDYSVIADCHINLIIDFLQKRINQVKDMIGNAADGTPKENKTPKTGTNPASPIKVEIVNQVQANVAGSVATTQPPSYLDNLSEDGLLDISKMQVLDKSLDDFAEKLRDELKRDITRKDLTQFKQSNGKPYSKKTIRQAIEKANAK